MSSSSDQTINLSILLNAKDQISGVLSLLKGSFSNFGSGVDGVNGQLDKLGKTGASTADAMKLVGGVMAGAVAVGIADIGVKSVKAAADFQSGMLVMQTSAGESAKNMNSVSQGVLSVATSVGMSAQTLVGPDGPLYQIESAGFHGAEGLNLLKAAAQGARAEGANVTKVADALSSTMIDYKIPASQAADVTSKLVAAVGAGKANFEQFTGALHTVLPIASAMHVPLNDILGDMASMTQHGMSADQATQDLSHALQKLQQPTAEMTSSMAQFGVTSSDLSDMLSQKGLSGTMNYLSDAVMTKLGDKTKVLIDAFNGNKVMAGDVLKMYASMPDALQKVANAYTSGSMSVKDYRTTIKDLPTDQANLLQQYVALTNKSKGFSDILKSGKNPMMDYSQAMKAMTGDTTTFTTALMISGENAPNTAKAINAVTKAHADGKGQVQGFAEWQQTLNGQLETAKAALGNAGIALGTAFLPPLTATIKVLTAVLVPIATWVNTHKELAAVIGASIGVFAALVATLLTVSFAMNKIKGAFSVLSVFKKGSKDVKEFGGVIDGVGKSAKEISNVAADTGKGIGGFIAGILKPLGSTEVLKGAASAALIGLAILLIAVGVNQASRAKVDIGNLAILMGSVVVIGLIFALMSTFAEYSAIGAIASAIIGGGLYLTALGVAGASKAAKDISVPNLAILMASVVAISGIFALMSLWSTFAAIGAIASAVIGGGLYVAALGVSGASDLAKNISVTNLTKLSGSLGIVAAIFALIAPMAGFSAIGTILAAVIGAGLVVAARGLLVASNDASQINDKNMDKLFAVIAKLATINSGGLINDLKNLIKTAILSATATEIAYTSQVLSTVKAVNNSVFDNMQSILEKLGKLDAGNLFTDWGNSVGTTSLVTVAKNVVSIADNLSNVKTVDNSKMQKIGDMINYASQHINTGDFIKNWMDSGSSGSLKNTTANVVTIADNLNKVKEVKPDLMDKIGDMIKRAGKIDFGNFWGNWGNANSSGKLKDSVDNIVKISEDIARIKMINQGEIDNLDKIQKFIDKAGGIKFNITAVTGADLTAMTNSGVELATKFVNGVQNLFSMAYNAGHELQGNLWHGVNDHMQDEWNQGHALAQKVIDGINNQHGAAQDAGHNIQGGMWNGIQSHMQDEYYQGVALAQQVTNGIWKQQSQWWSAGDAVAGGFAGGIRRNMWQVNDAVGQLSGAAINKLKSLLQIHSPSKVMDEIGQNVSLGMAQGITGQSGAVAKATGSIVPSIQLSGNMIRSGTASNPSANINTATSGSLAGGNSGPAQNITLNVNVGAYAGAPGELNQLATTLWQQLQVIARQHGQATALPNIGIRPV